jgi:hypothetical protein
LESCLPKIQYEANLQPSCPQVIQKLRFRGCADVILSLQFQKQLVFNNQICDVLSNNLLSVPYDYWGLSHIMDPSSIQLDRKGILVHCLQEAAPKAFVHLDGAANNAS